MIVVLARGTKTPHTILTDADAKTTRSRGHQDEKAKNPHYHNKCNTLQRFSPYAVRSGSQCTPKENPPKRPWLAPQACCGGGSQLSPLFLLSLRLG